MLGFISQEYKDFKKHFSSLGKAELVYLILPVVLIMLMDYFSFRSTWLNAFANEQWLGMPPALIKRIVYFAMMFLCGFIIPVLIQRFIFKQSIQGMGLGRGDVHFSFKILMLYVPLVALGTFALAHLEGFQKQYPRIDEVKTSWLWFVLYQGFFLFYWIGWEYLFRGFMLFGLYPRFGYYAVLLQTIPFALRHVTKPFPEDFLSILGGIVLGFLILRARSFWVAVPIHFVQMFFLELFCVLLR